MRDLEAFVHDPDYWMWGPCLCVHLRYSDASKAYSARDGLLGDPSAVYVGARDEQHLCAILLPEFEQALCGVVCVHTDGDGPPSLCVGFYPRSVRGALAELGSDSRYWYRPDPGTVGLTGALVGLLRRFWWKHPYRWGEIFDESMSLAVSPYEQRRGLAVHAEIAKAAGWEHEPGDRFALLALT